jgi:MFS transporter, DHA1 family, multidrug resistance protein
MVEPTSPAPQTTPPARPGWSFVVLLSALGAVGPLSIDMYLPSLPSIASNLGAGSEATQATVAIFFAGMALGQLFYGPASDRIGRRPPILLGLALYVAGSVASTLSQHIGVLLVARLAQALGACACTVIVRAVVRDHFNHQESARFFSLLALIMGTAPILAPLVGSLLLGVVGWRGIFAVLAVFGALLFCAALFRLPESRSEAVARHARAEHPLRSYWSVFQERRVVGYVLAAALNGAALFTYIASSANVLIGIYGVPPTRYGILLGINSIGLIGASQLNRALLRRFNADTVLATAALAGSGATLLLLLAAVTGAFGLVGLLVPMFLTISSVSLIQANSVAGALAADPLRAGSTAALLGACSFAAGALAGSLAGVFHDGTARPMSLVIAVCSIGCAITVRLLAVRPRSQTASA